jgi:tyrosyl-tRNA synthetase
VQTLSHGEGLWPSDAIVVNNDEWVSSLRYLRFLWGYGKHFTINCMLVYR